MTRYRTKQFEIEARQLGKDYDADVDIMRWCNGTPTNSIVEGALFHVPTRKKDALRATATAVARKGDWVVKLTEGFVVLTDAEFQERYEVVPTAAATATATVTPTAAATKTVAAPSATAEAKANG